MAQAFGRHKQTDLCEFKARVPDLPYLYREPVSNQIKTKMCVCVRKVTQWLRVHSAVAEELHLIASTHIGHLTTISSPGHLMPSFGLHRYLLSRTHKI